MKHDALREKIETYSALPADGKLPRDARKIVDELLDSLEAGRLRAAEKKGRQWEAVPWVKQGILLGFRIGKLVDSSLSLSWFSFVDKDTYPPRRFKSSDGI